MDPNIVDHLVDFLGQTWAAIGVHSTLPAIYITLAALLLPFVSSVLFALAQRDPPLPPPVGCRRLGLQGRSNLWDQYSKKYATGADPSPTSPWTVKALFIYPVKSCAPIELDQSNVVRTGFEYDRQFAFGQQVTSLPSLDGRVTSNWVCATLRTFPRLAKIETQLWIPDPTARDYDPEGEWVESEGCIVFRFPFTPDVDFSLDGLRNYGKLLAAKLAGQLEPMLEFRIPYIPTKERMQTKQYTWEKYKIWGDNPVALNMGHEIPAEMMARLKYTLGVTNPFTLFRIDPNAYRKVRGNASGNSNSNSRTIIGMQDSYPVHIQNLASIHHVSARLPRNSPIHPLNALRFRPNIVITGPPPFAEDFWGEVRIGSESAFHVACRTTRCKLPNVDPQSGIADRSQPLSTMLGYRVIDAGSKAACLGMQLSPLEYGVLKVGERVVISKSG